MGVRDGLIRKWFYLLLLAEVYSKHFWVALRPFYSMKSCPCSNCLI